MIEVLFFAAILGYGLGTALYATGLSLGAPRAVSVAFVVALVSVLAHSGVVVLHALENGELPLGGLDAAAVAAWDHPFSTIACFLMCGVAVVGSLRPALRIVGAFVVPVCLGLTLAGLLGSDAGARTQFLPGALDSSWQPVHTLSVYASFALFAVAFGSGIAYLIQHSRLKRKRLPLAGETGLRLPALDVLERVNHRGFAGGLVFLTLGIVTGTFWLHTGAGEGADLRPKVGFTLALWLLYALGWQARSLMGWGGRRTAWIAIVGFVGVLISVLGVQHG